MACESGDGGGSDDLVFCVILLEGILVLCGSAKGKLYVEKLKASAI